MWLVTPLLETASKLKVICPQASVIYLAKHLGRMMASSLFAHRKFIRTIDACVCVLIFCNVVALQKVSEWQAPICSS